MALEYVEVTTKKGVKAYVDKRLIVKFIGGYLQRKHFNGYRLENAGTAAVKAFPCYICVNEWSSFEEFEVSPSNKLDQEQIIDIISRYLIKELEQ